MNCCTNPHGAISGIRGAHHALPGTTHSHDQAPADPATLSNTSVFIDEVIRVSRLKVNSNFYAPETFSWLRRRVMWAGRVVYLLETQLARAEDKAQLQAYAVSSSIALSRSAAQSFLFLYNGE